MNPPRLLNANFPLLIYRNQSSIFQHQYHLVTPYIFSNNLLHFKVFLAPHKVLPLHVLINQLHQPFQGIF